MFDNIQQYQQITFFFPSTWDFPPPSSFHFPLIYLSLNSLGSLLPLISSHLPFIIFIVLFSSIHFLSSTFFQIHCPYFLYFHFPLFCLLPFHFPPFFFLSSVSFLRLPFFSFLPSSSFLQFPSFFFLSFIFLTFVSFLPFSSPILPHINCPPLFLLLPSPSSYPPLLISIVYFSRYFSPYSVSSSIPPLYPWPSP